MPRLFASQFTRHLCSEPPFQPPPLSARDAGVRKALRGIGAQGQARCHNPHGQPRLPCAGDCNAVQGPERETHRQRLPRPPPQGRYVLDTTSSDVHREGRREITKTVDARERMEKQPQRISRLGGKTSRRDEGLDETESYRLRYRCAMVVAAATAGDCQSQLRSQAWCPNSTADSADRIPPFRAKSLGQAERQGAIQIGLAGVTDGAGSCSSRPRTLWNDTQVHDQGPRRARSTSSSSKLFLAGDLHIPPASSRTSRFRSPSTLKAGKGKTKLSAGRFPDRAHPGGGRAGRVVEIPGHNPGLGSVLAPDATGRPLIQLRGGLSKPQFPSPSRATRPRVVVGPTSGCRVSYIPNTLSNPRRGVTSARGDAAP
jgi:hypothetical protein